MVSNQVEEHGRSKNRKLPGNRLASSTTIAAVSESVVWLFVIFPRLPTSALVDIILFPSKNQHYTRININQTKSPHQCESLLFLYYANRFSRFAFLNKAIEYFRFPRL
jgi:hypothetical protein